MRRETVLSGIESELRADGLPRHVADRYFQLFQAALDTATGADAHSGLGGYIPIDEGEESIETTQKNVDAILLSSAIMFAGAEIGDSIREGLTEIARAIEQLADRN